MCPTCFYTETRVGRRLGLTGQLRGLHTFPTAWASSRDLELNSTTSLNMPPSRSRLEREDPPPRRKSCHACVKAKRRCDQKLPTCTRCSQRKIACQYPSWPARFEAAPISPSPATPRAFGTEFLPDDSGVDETFVNFLAPTYNAEPINNPWASRKSPCLHHPVRPGAQGEALGSSIEVADATSLGLALANRDILLHENLDADMFFDFTDGTLLGKDVAARPPHGVPAALGRLDLAGLHAALETNFSYAMERIKTAHPSMLLNNQTPWCHPLLYRDNMPREMQGKNHQCSRLPPGHMHFE